MLHQLLRAEGLAGSGKFCQKGAEFEQALVSYSEAIDVLRSLLLPIGSLRVRCASVVNDPPPLTLRFHPPTQQLYLGWFANVPL